MTDCASCGMALRTKALKALPEGNPLRLKAELLAPKIFEATDYLLQIGLAQTPGPLAVACTYHVPCHRGWTPTLNDAPRELVTRVPGVELKEMEFPEKCCGGGGAFFMDFRELSQGIRSHKLEDIQTTGAKLVLTQCPSCRSYLAPALPDSTVLRPLSLLAKAYGFGG